MKNTKIRWDYVIAIPIGIFFIYGIISNYMTEFQERRYTEAYEECLNNFNFDDSNELKMKAEFVNSLGVEKVKEEMLKGNKEVIRTMFPDESEVENFCNDYAFKQ